MADGAMMQLFEVTVRGFGANLVHAKSRAAAKYDAYLSDAFSGMTFKAFLGICSVRRAEAPADDGYGQLRQHYPDACIPVPGARIRAEGLTGTVLPAPRPTSYVVFEPDGCAREAFVHPMSVELLTDDR